MPDYSFETLSPHDFEELSRDLLQEEWGVRLESFKSGRDKGIDLRYCRPDSPQLKKTIIQCKHYARSGFSNLKSQLKLHELPKIQSLKPDEYVLTTSVKLSPPQKDELFELLTPFVKSPSDIYGKEDLNNLLGLHERVEQNHFKLWLPSTAVLQKLLHAGVFTQSALEIEEINRHLSMFVTTDAIRRAMKIIEDSGFCMLSGIPGIGKTTTARVAIARHLVDAWEAICLTSDVSQAFEVFNPEQKQIFLYDDFLGQTSVDEKLNKNEDKSLKQLIDACRRNPTTKRLVLTTRGHLYEQATQQYEALKRAHLELSQCTVKLEDYTNKIRAEILVNHLYFYGIDIAVCSEFVKSGDAKRALQHPNYNPRLVESMCELQRIENLDADKFRVRFIEILDTPEEIWDKAFNSQLSKPSQEVLLIFAVLGNNVQIDVLKDSYYLYKSKTGQSLVRFEEEFRRCMEQLEGCFLNVHPSSDLTYVTFHNPSIKDFTDRVLQSEVHILQTVFRYFPYDAPVVFAAKVLVNSRSNEISIKELQDRIETTDCDSAIWARKVREGVIADKNHFKDDSILSWLEVAKAFGDSKVIRSFLAAATHFLKGIQGEGYNVRYLVRIYWLYSELSDRIGFTDKVDGITFTHLLIACCWSPDDLQALSAFIDALEVDEKTHDELCQDASEVVCDCLHDWLDHQVSETSSSTQLDSALEEAKDAADDFDILEDDLNLDSFYQELYERQEHEEEYARSHEDDGYFSSSGDVIESQEIDQILDSLRE